MFECGGMAFGEAGFHASIAIEVRAFKLHHYQSASPGRILFAGGQVYIIGLSRSQNGHHRELPMSVEIVIKYCSI
jgi:hypothetical protein